MASIREIKNDKKSRDTAPLKWYNKSAKTRQFRTGVLFPGQLGPCGTNTQLILLLDSIASFH